VRTAARVTRTAGNVVAGGTVATMDMGQGELAGDTIATANGAASSLCALRITERLQENLEAFLRFHVLIQGTGSSGGACDVDADDNVGSRRVDNGNDDGSVSDASHQICANHETGDRDDVPDAIHGGRRASSEQDCLGRQSQQRLGELQPGSPARLLSARRYQMPKQQRMT